MRRLTVVLAAAAVVGGGVAAAPSPALAGPPGPVMPSAPQEMTGAGASYERALGRLEPLAKPPVVDWVRCGSATPERARCGRIKTPADPQRPELGRQTVGFEYYPRKDKTEPSRGTLVAHEGGPGYPSTESRTSFLAMFGPLAKHRAVLLVDKRGTGLSGVIRCEGLQRGDVPYLKAVEQCGEQLGERADTYGTAYAADDMALVLDALGIEQIDLYGDSYGTFFSQTFALRHPDRVRTLVLDAAYPVSDQDPWYRDTNRAISDAVDRVCDRDPDCAAIGGSALDRLRDLAAEVDANPVTGRAYDAEGVRRTVTVDAVNLALVTAYATYGVSVYRELDAAIRAWEAGDRKPLLRLVAENISDEVDSSSVRYYSAGEYIATICNDYPALWDVALPPGDERVAEYRAARADLEADQPDAFDPFSVPVWIKTGWGEPRTCLRWPSPTDPVLPEGPGTVYPDTPTLVLSGDLDSVTSPEGGEIVADLFPEATFVSSANVGHVVALGDAQGCAEDLVRDFVRTGGVVGDTTCVEDGYPAVRLPQFARDVADLTPADQGSVVQSVAGDRRVVEAALLSAADVFPRWYNNYTGDGVGLRGGTYSYRGDDVTVFGLRDYSFVRDVAVNGTVRWDRTTGEVSATLSVDGPGRRDGELRVRWSDWDGDARAKVRGALDGRSVYLSTSAPTARVY